MGDSEGKGANRCCSLLSLKISHQLTFEVDRETDNSWIQESFSRREDEVTSCLPIRNQRLLFSATDKEESILGTRGSSLLLLLSLFLCFSKDVASN